VLEGVVTGGTGTAAAIDRPVAGKTGTAQEWRNAWFVGFTPDLVTAVWVGYPQDEKTSMVPPLTPIKVTGGTWPAQIWQLYMSAALAEVPISHFPTPPGAAAVAGPVDTSPRTVPSVVGDAFDQAAARLAQAGFKVERHDRPDPDYPPGVVSAQSPRGGTVARGASVVTLDVSTGRADLTPVPDLLGLTPPQAAAALQAAGLAVKTAVAAEPHSPGAAARVGLVWKQSPIAGAPAARRDVVTVFVNPVPPPTTTTSTLPPPPPPPLPPA
jgi:membrane peptidoglycan carboxypeptidase